MNTQPNTAQNPGNQEPAPKLNPNFSHRLGPFDGEATSLNLTDAVSALALQADGVISLLSSRYLGDEKAFTLADDVIFWALGSVQATVKDISALVEAYHEAQIKLDADTKPRA